MNTTFLDTYNFLTSAQRETAVALLRDAISAEVRRQTSGRGTLTLTIKGEGEDSPYVWREIQIGLDGMFVVAKKEMRKPSVFDDPPDFPRSESRTAEPVRKLDAADLYPDEETDLNDVQTYIMRTIEEDETELEQIDPVLDVLLNPAAQMTDRVTVLANVCAGAVRRGLAGTELHPDLVEAETLRGTLGMLGQVIQVASVAQLQIALKMDAVDTRYITEDGVGRDLVDEIRMAMPDQADSGRARMIARFLTEGSRILLTAGIKPEEIALVLKDNKPSKLAVVSIAVQRIFKDELLNTESKVIEYRKVLASAKNLSARELQRKYGKHRFPPADAYIQSDGIRGLRVVMWPSVNQWEAQLSPRIGNALNFDSMRVDEAVTPQMILDSDGDLTKIFRVAVKSNIKRRAVLGVMAHDGPVTVRYLASILMDLNEQQVTDILGDLVRWGLVEKAKSGNQTVYKLGKETNNVQTR